MEDTTLGCVGWMPWMPRSCDAMMMMIGYCRAVNDVDHDEHCSCCCCCCYQLVIVQCERRILDSLPLEFENCDSSSSSFAAAADIDSQRRPRPDDHSSLRGASRPVRPRQ